MDMDKWLDKFHCLNLLAIILLFRRKMNMKVTFWDKTLTIIKDINHKMTVIWILLKEGWRAWKKSIKGTSTTSLSYEKIIQEVSQDQ